MFSWFRRHRAGARRIEADAAALLARDRLSVDSEARRQQDARDEDVFAHWDRVMHTVAQLTGREVGLDSATEARKEAGLSDARRGQNKEPDQSEKPDQIEEPDQIEKLERILRRRRE